MRKIIETASTLALWAVFIIGSSIAISDFFFATEASELMKLHLTLVAWAPLVAIVIFGAMLYSVRTSKFELKKKTLPSEHSVQWTAEELMAAQTGKVVDLHFPAPGLACQVVAREEAATVLHAENKTVEVKVAMPAAGVEPAWNLQKVVARSIIVFIVLVPNALRDYVGRHF
jgi:hypothetical protein